MEVEGDGGGGRMDKEESRKKIKGIEKKGGEKKRKRFGLMLVPNVIRFLKSRVILFRKKGKEIKGKRKIWERVI